MLLKNVKKIFYVIIVVALFIAPVVKAKSSYYNYIWTNSTEETSVTNDILESDDDYISIGFERDVSIIRKIDEQGQDISEDYTNIEGKLKRIIKVDNYYYVFGALRENGIVVSKINDNLEVEDTYTIEVSDDYSSTSEVYLEEDENYYYLLSPDYASKHVIRINKDLSSIEEISYTELSSEIQSIIANYTRLTTLKDESYYPIFCQKYLDGYLYSLYSNDENLSYLAYYKNNELQWEKESSQFFYRDAEEINGNIYLLAIDSNENSNIVILDSNGSELSTDSLSNYYEAVNESSEESEKSISEGAFYPEHIISSSNGFFITGIKSYTYECIPPAPRSNYEISDNSPASEIVGVPDGGDSNQTCTTNINRILYFSNIYNIKTKTDGNGIVETSKVQANNGEEVLFKITPNEGYVLSEVKVTDINGNVLVFTSNTFTMPSSDVIIEATFKVENPNTADILTIIILLLGIFTLVTFIKFQKKLKWLK